MTKTKKNFETPKIDLNSFLDLAIKWQTMLYEIW